MHRAPSGLAVTLALAATAICAALSACGGSRSSQASDTAARAEQSAETRFADYARCLREHGVQAQAISAPGGGHGLKVMPGRGGGPAAMEAAEKACARYRPERQQEASLSPQQKVELQERLQRFARCMREHGIPVEASATGGVRVTLRGQEGRPLPNPESPAMRRAQSSCQRLIAPGAP